MWSRALELIPTHQPRMLDDPSAYVLRPVPELRCCCRRNLDKVAHLTNRMPAPPASPYFVDVYVCMLCVCYMQPAPEPFPLEPQ